MFIFNVTLEYDVIVKKRELFEIKLYKFIGITLFRKMVFLLEKWIHRKDNGKNDNYHIRNLNIQSINGFIKFLFYNGSIHVKNLLFILVFFFIKLCIIGRLQWLDLFVLFLFLKDLYCVILQRYTYLNIKRKKETMIQIYNNILERESKRIDLSVIENYDWQIQQKDLQFVRQLREKISSNQCIILNDEDADTINRLVLLLKSRQKY